MTMRLPFLLAEKDSTAAGNKLANADGSFVSQNLKTIRISYFINTTYSGL